MTASTATRVCFNRARAGHKLAQRRAPAFVLGRAALVLVASLWGCARAVEVRTAPAGENPAAEFIADLRASADAWNRGDLEGFLEPYLGSPETTYIGGAGLLRGKEAIRENYQNGYWSAGAPAATLSFEDIEVSPLGVDHALVVGRWVLTPPGAAQPAGTGFFSLVLVRTPEGWKIVHDHSS